MWGGGRREVAVARRKTTKGRTGFFYRASGFKMTALEAEMTQIIEEGVEVGGEWWTFILQQNGCGLVWEWRISGRGGAIHGNRNNRKCSLGTTHPSIQVNHCSVGPALIP